MKFFIRFFLLTTLLLVTLLPAQAATLAQGVYQWLSPRQVPNYGLTSRPPLMVADQNRNVHVFNYESSGLQPGAIYYRRWSLDQGWTPPVDILLPGIGAGASTLQSVFFDSTGILHLVYYSGTEVSGSLYYTRAYAIEADRAQSWSTPVIIGPTASTFPAAYLTGDGQGRLVMLYGGQEFGVGLYETHSTDGGLNWSDAAYLTLLTEEETWPASIRGEWLGDRLHLVWSIVSVEGVGTEVHYSRLNTQDFTWEQDTVLAERSEGEYSTTWPSIISDENQLIVIYQDSFPATRWMVRSPDFGETWTVPVRPFPEIGEYENAVLLKDSAGTVHMILGNRTQTPEIHGMWYSRWLGNRWTPLEPILSGPVTRTFDPSAPQAVVSQGNLLLAAWWNNVRRENLSGAWFSYARLDAPELPLVALATPPSEPTVFALPTPLPATPEPTGLPTATPFPTGAFSGDPPPTNPASPIFLGIFPVIVLVAVLLGRRFSNSRNR